MRIPIVSLSCPIFLGTIGADSEIFPPICQEGSTCSAAVKIRSKLVLALTFEFRYLENKGYGYNADIRYGFVHVCGWEDDD